MKKFLLFTFSIFIFYSYILSTHAAWYWSHAENMTFYDGKTWCSTDGDITWWSVNFTPWNWFPDYTYDSRVTNVSWSYDMLCEYRDNSNPTWWTVIYTDLRVNSAQTVTYGGFTDAGWSKMYGMYLYENSAPVDNNGTIWSWAWRTLVKNVLNIGNNSSWTDTYTRPFQSWKAYTYTTVSYDRAILLSSFITSTNTIKMESVLPTWWSVTTFNGWTNTTQTVTYGNFSDLWWSKLNRIILEQSTSDVNDNWDILWWGTYSQVDSIPSNIWSNSSSTDTYTTVFQNKKAYKYRAVAYDNAGNSKITYGTDIIYMENEKPTWLITSFSWWTNKTITTFPYVEQPVGYTIGDTGWSKIIKYLLTQSVSADSPNFNSWTPYWTPENTADALNTNAKNETFTYTYLNHHAYKYKIQVWDRAGNTETFYSNSTPTKVDITVPTMTDILTATSVPADNSNLLATGSQNFKVAVDVALWSPIVSVKWFLEDWNTINNFKATSNDYANYVWWSNENIQNVDNSRVDPSWERTYTLRVVQIKDEAGNILWTDNVSSTPHKDLTYKVYANTLLTTWWSWKTLVTYNSLTWSNLTANGLLHRLDITLNDIYWNQIIPATWINRTIDFKFNVNNTMYLNQQTRSWTSSVFLTNANSGLTDPNNFTPKFSIWNPITNTLTNQNSSSGVYTYGFKVYTPTANVYTSNPSLWPVSDPSAELTFNNIKFDVNCTWPLSNTPNQWIVWNKDINSSTFNTKFKPMFYSYLSWSLNSIWFIEWAVQTWTLTLTATGTLPSFTAFKTHLTFWDESSKYTLKYAEISNPIHSATSVITSNYLHNYISPPLVPPAVNIYLPTVLSPSVTPLRTLLRLVSFPAPRTLQAYLASHISYTLDTHNIVYNSDIIGRPQYWKDSTATLADYNSWALANQAGLKIVWIVSSQKTTEILAGQLWNEIKIVWNTNKLISKTNMVKNGYAFAKNVTWSTDTNALTNIDIPNIASAINNVIYFGNTSNWSNTTYTVWDWTNNIAISTKKTILVIGANLYIKSNLYYSDKKNGMLGIIVLKDKAWNGWNIYIDPKITNIVWSIFAERSVISYDGTHELDGNTEHTILKNQLHIYGNVFSENTIGWSVKATPQCPYYITSCPDKETAQKYDLNYLRRYYLVTDWESTSTPKSYKPANNGKAIWWGTYNTTDKNGTIDWWNSYFARNITNTNQPYAANSVVIEYNQNIQLNPPPLFTIQ